MPYIHFTEDQKQRAASVDLVDSLRRQGEKLIRHGMQSFFCLASSESCPASSPIYTTHIQQASWNR